MKVSWSPKPRRARSKAPPKHARDMEASPFAAILAELVRRLPGARAAVLVDHDGECVDYTGDVEPFELKILGAHWRIVLDQATASLAPRSGALEVLVIRGANKSVIVRALPERYAVVVLLGRRAGFGRTDRALADCEQALAAEAGWNVRPRWFGVTVECDAKRRPVRIVYGGLEEPVEVLGTVPPGAGGLGRRERGFRIRLASGPEITVVRDAGGHWYAEESGVG